MDALIPIMNKLHDVFNAVETDLIQLPQIVVIGTQSSGKSSVLESLVGRDFLPRGPGIVTRCPLVLQLVYTPKQDTNHPDEDSTPHAEEWGIFLHTGSKIYSEFQEIRKEIDEEMERKSGSKKGISYEAINLKIYSPNVINLTLVDLPGITKVPIGDQPEDIEMQLRQLILKYIKNPNAIILAVTPANTDFATSESLKLARECDPSGKRTLAVVTKLDLMDAGTDASDVLCGRVIPVTLGIIGVVNRSQQDILNDKSINDSIKDEELFLQRKYPAIASKIGTPFLRKTLNKLLIHHIGDGLPQLKTRINRMISHYQTVINSYGDIIIDQNQKLLQIITKFASFYCSTIEGTARNIKTSELSGGARICYIFHEVFGRTLHGINPLNELSPLDILTAIRNATGTRPALFVPEVAFELLVKRQIQRLEKPCLRCVELVYDEMQRIIQHCSDEFQQEIHRFPKLHEKIEDVVTQLLQKRLPATNIMVQNLVTIETAYINTKHPDFHDDIALINMHKKQTETNIVLPSNVIVEAKELNDASIEINYELNNKVAETSRDINATHESKESSDFIKQNSKELDEINCKLVPDISNPQNQSWVNGFEKSVTLKNDRDPSSEKVSFCFSHFNSFSSLCSIESSMRTRNLSTFEKQECEIIEHLIQSYFTIVRKNIQDAVPKAIMHFLVNYVKDNLQSELVKQLYKQENLSTLLKESEDISTGRQEANEMLQALQKANIIISEIRDIPI